MSGKASTRWVIWRENAKAGGGGNRRCALRDPAESSEEFRSVSRRIETLVLDLSWGISMFHNIIPGDMMRAGGNEVCANPPGKSRRLSEVRKSALATRGFITPGISGFHNEGKAAEVLRNETLRRPPDADRGRSPKIRGGSDPGVERSRGWRRLFRSARRRRMRGTINRRPQGLRHPVDTFGVYPRGGTLRLET